MKKFLLIIIISSLFVGFVAYATVKTIADKNSDSLIPKVPVVNDTNIPISESKIIPNITNIVETFPTKTDDSIIDEPIITKKSIPLVSPKPAQKKTINNYDERNEEYDD